jgi:imidazolonepropionase-like amidohydrolase
MDDLTLVARRLFDGRSLREGRFCLEARRGLITGIRRIGADDALPKRAVDFGDATLMPGLIDAHCHMARAGQFEAHEPPSLSAVGHNLRAALDAGITTAGDMGSALHLISELRNFLEEDSSAGPALRAAGPILTVPLGYPLDWMSPLHRWLGIAVAIASERDARQAVERIAHAGMDHVKICIMHRAYDLSPLPVFSQKLAAAVVDEAHALGLRVLAHAHWNADYRVALAAKVDALMHSSFDPLDEDIVRRVADSGVMVCPTLWVFHSACLGAEQRFDRDPERMNGVVPAVRRSWKRFVEAYMESGDVMPPGMVGGLPKEAAKRGVRNAVANLKLLHDAGVSFAYGSDGPFGFSVVNRPVDELGCLRDAGLPRLDVLRAATSGAARLLGLSDRGVLAEGKRADIVAVPGNPLGDLSALTRTLAVYRAGHRVDGSSHRVREGRVARGVAGTLARAAVGRSLS